MYNFILFVVLSTSLFSMDQCADIPVFDEQDYTKKISTTTMSRAGIIYEIPQITGENPVIIIPSPKLAPGFDCHSPVAKAINTVWDLNHFLTPRKPIELFDVADIEEFTKWTGIRVLDMPIKLAGSNDYRVPHELEQFKGVLQQIIDHEHAMLSEKDLEPYYAYLTIDQSFVKKDKHQRESGLHVDGFQGERMEDKVLIEHVYTVFDRFSTLFYPQSFDFSKLDEKKHNFFWEMDRLAKGSCPLEVRPFAIHLFDAYTVHEGASAAYDAPRTFVRLTYAVRVADRNGNTHNPCFDYSWELFPRDKPVSLARYNPEDIQA